jgi:ribosomal protein S18 acetylase RimI-like enzyme
VVATAGAVNVRRARAGDDLASIDTSFTTATVYDVVRTRQGFALRERRASPRVRKRYELPPRNTGETVLVAEADDGALAGVAIYRVADWNRRGELVHLYVDRRRRGRGAGSALVEEVVARVRAAGARALWLETQNVNAPAIRFYRGRGFRLAGLDESLYDPEEFPGEVALFFVRDL